MATVNNARLYIKGYWDSYGLNNSGQIMNNPYWYTNGDVWQSAVIFQTNATRNSSDYLTTHDNSQYILPYLSVHEASQDFNTMIIAPSSVPTFDSDSKSYLDLSSSNYNNTKYKFTTDSSSGYTVTGTTILFHTYCYDWGDHHRNYVVVANCTPEHISQSDFNTGSATIVDSYYVNLGTEKSKLIQIDPDFNYATGTDCGSGCGILESHTMRYHQETKIQDYYCVNSTCVGQFNSNSSTFKYATKDVLGVLYITMHPSTFHNNVRIIDKDTTDHTISISLTDNSGIKSIT